MEIKQRSMLFEEMNNRLSNDELKILCFKLNIDYDNIPGRDKQTKIVELINLIERQGKYQFFLETLVEAFPYLSVSKHVSYLLRAQRAPTFLSPPQQKGFVNRKKDISTITRILGENQKNIFWLGGLRGIGKTSLAAILYQELQSQSANHTFWIDIASDQTTLQQLMIDLSHFSSETDLINSVQNPTERVSVRARHLISKFLEPQKSVLFFDDYDQYVDDEFNEFIIQCALHGRNLKIFLISHVYPQILDDPQLIGTKYEYLVQGLEIDSIASLFSEFNLTQKQIRTIWKKCAEGNPLALNIFKNAMRRHPLEYLLKLPLWDIGDSLPRWLDSIIGELSTEEIHCLKIASFFPSAFLYSSLVFIDGNKNINRVINNLVDKGLLIYLEKDSLLMVQHKILKDYIFQELTTLVEQEQIKSNIALYYADFVRQQLEIPTHLLPQKNNIIAAMEWWLERRDGTRRRLFELFHNRLTLTIEEALNLTFRLGEIFRIQGQAEVAQTCFREVNDQTKLIGLRFLQARTLFNLADIDATNNKDLESAIEKLESALELITELEKNIGTLSFAARIAHRLGQLLRNPSQGRIALAQNYLEQGLNAARQSGDYFTLAQIVGSLTYLYQTQSNFEKALQLYESERHLLSGEPLAVLTVGIIPRLFEMGNFQEGLEKIGEAREIYTKENNLGGIAYTWRLEGQYHVSQKNIKLAERAYLNELSLREEAIKSRPEELYYLLQALRSQHWFFIQTEQLERAQESRQKYTSLLGEEDYYCAQLLENESDLLVKSGKHVLAQNHLHYAQEIYQRLNNIGGQAWIKRRQGDSLAQVGQFTRALGLYKEGLALRNLTNESWEIARDYEHVGHFIIDKLNDPGLAKPFFERALTEYQLMSAVESQNIIELLEQM